MKKPCSSFALTAIFILTSCEPVNEPAVCADVVSNATLQRIGFSQSDSTLSITFFNALSYCTPDLPYQINRIDISLKDFSTNHELKKTEEPEVYPQLQSSQMLFNGEISCLDTCEINIPISLPEISVSYIRKTTGDIVIKLNTNETIGEFILTPF